MVDFAVSDDQRVKLKKVKREINTKTLQENWKTMEHENDGDNNRNWCSQYNHRRIGKETGGLGNKRTSGDHLLTLLWKTLNWVK